MKPIKPSPNPQRWPRHRVTSVECRKRDLVLRITDWTSDRDEPGYDVEVYVGGVYDWNLSKCCTRYEYKTDAAAKRAAIAHAQLQVKALL